MKKISLTFIVANNSKSGTFLDTASPALVIGLSGILNQQNMRTPGFYTTVTGQSFFEAFQGNFFVIQHTIVAHGFCPIPGYFMNRYRFMFNQGAKEAITPSFQF